MTIDEMRKNFGTVIEGGKEYILTEQAYVTGPADCYHYEADAIIPADGADEDGYYPLYTITWSPTADFLNYAAECARNGDPCDEGDACDWGNPDDIEPFDMRYDLVTNSTVW